MPGTLGMMDQPRCSLPDIIGTSELMRRRKRYAHSGSVWPMKQLTWRVRSYPQASGLAPDLVRTLLFYALQAWANASALTFREAPGADADILVEFSRSFHQDGYPFDGPGSTLAHAFFPGEHPISGDTHFDDEETWTYDPQAKERGQQGAPRGGGGIGWGRRGVGSGVGGSKGPHGAGSGEGALWGR
uniref:Peptidase metallopeptidase domain-containing protein n=1 Tax=Chelydra serpentina TaxID=8475 RepID=A0A8C3XM28_CHESE